MKTLKKIFLITVALTIIHFSAAQTPEQEIREIMKKQEACWNRGDLDGFMRGYRQSDELVFIGSRGLTYGWTQTLENYRKSYPDAEAMGKLKLAVKLIRPLGDNFRLVAGTWELRRKGDNPKGYFSLIWENTGGEWRIIADHSS